MNDRAHISVLLIASAFISTHCVTVFAQPPTGAPALNLTVTTSLYEAVRFLFEAEPAVQRDLVPGTIVPMRASLVRGIVLGPDDQPRTGVRVEVHGHPEYGSTLTREGGRYDLVVNGGDSLVLNFTEPGRMSAHRRWAPPWNEAQDLAPVKLLGADGAATVIDFTDPIPIQVHRATEVGDEDGTRQAALMFRQGTVATMVMPDESTEEISQLTVRATEFTVGENGPASMPAELPTGTQYTYAIEFTADEAEGAGALTVEFDTPALLYVENFLEIPVGTVVPVGTYSRTDARWSTEPNGRVVEILVIAAGAAELDLEGEGVAATAAELAEAGITQAEREALADPVPRRPRAAHQDARAPLHSADGRQLRRASAGRCDGAPEDSPEENQEEDEHCEREGSIIECENQILGQRIEIPGTPFSLNYRTSRVPGAPSRHLRIPIAGNSIPASLLRARLDVTVAERTFTSTFDDVEPGQSQDFAWDGLDAYGRAVQGAQPTRVCVTYDYPATYAGTPRAINEEIFGDWLQDGVAVPGRNNSEVGLSRCYSRGPYAGARNAGTINKANMIRLGGLDARTSAAGLGGWTLSVHHTLGLETGHPLPGNRRKARSR